MAGPSSSRGLCPDWVFSTASNAQDRAWFAEYTPFKSVAGSIYSPDMTVAVAGIGTVCLPVKKSPNRSGPDAHGQLLLRDVLHTPDSVCNVIGLCESFKAQYPTGRSVAYFAPNKKLFRVKLSGPPIGPVVGPSGLEDALFVINVRWSKDERARWEAFKLARGNSTNGQSDQEHSSELGQKKAKVCSVQREAPYTLEEKRWLKVHYGGEFHFLQAHGLSIFKDEDREEGRSIMRAFMAEEGPEGRECVDSLLRSDDDGDSTTDEDHGDSDDEDEDVSDDEDEEDNAGHMADYHFDEEVLNWINKNFGNSMNFMYSYGLKFYNDDDCDEAKAIARALMTAG